MKKFLNYFLRFLAFLMIVNFIGFSRELYENAPVTTFLITIFISLLLAEIYKSDNN